MTPRSTPTPPFVSPSPIGQWVTGLLLVSIALDSVGVLSTSAQIALLSRIAAGERFTIAEAAASDSRQATIGVLQLVAYLSTGVLFLIWIHRAHRNLPALGVEGLRFTPGWAVGGFLIPFLNLVRPFQVVTEVWKASDPSLGNESTWKASPVSPIVGWWWALLLISSTTGYAASKGLTSGSGPSPRPSELLTGSWLQLAGDLLSIPAGIMAVLLVRGMNRRQAAKAARIASEAPALAGMRPLPPAPYDQQMPHGPLSAARVRPEAAHSSESRELEPRSADPVDQMMKKCPRGPPP